MKKRIALTVTAIFIISISAISFYYFGSGSNLLTNQIYTNIFKDLHISSADLTHYHSTQKIPVGIIYWKGSGAVVGSSKINAADLFTEEHENTLIQPVPIDDELDPGRSVSVIRESMENGIKFFISIQPSKCAVASIHLFSQPSAIIINTASTSPALTGKDDYFIRIIADGEQEQRVIARFVNTLPGNRLLVLQDTGNLPYTDPAFKYFSQELTFKRYKTDCSQETCGF